MNKKQKTVTLIFLIIFCFSCFRVQWYTRTLRGGNEIVEYRIGTIFKPPINMNAGATISINIAYTWAAILIGYGLFYALTCNRKKE